MLCSEFSETAPENTFLSPWKTKVQAYLGNGSMLCTMSEKKTWCFTYLAVTCLFFDDNIIEGRTDTLCCKYMTKQACGLFELLLEAKVPVFQIPVSASPFPSLRHILWGRMRHLPVMRTHSIPASELVYNIRCVVESLPRTLHYVVSTPLCPFSGMCRQG